MMHMKNENAVDGCFAVSPPSPRAVTPLLSLRRAASHDAEPENPFTSQRRTLSACSNRLATSEISG